MEFCVHVLDHELAQVWVDFINDAGDVVESQFVGGVMNIERARELVRKMNDRVRLDNAAQVG